MGIYEEKILHRQRVRRKFKQIIRAVVNNIYWLNDVESTELGDSVFKNVNILTREKKDKGLTLSDKSILRKPAEDRTEAEKIHLDRIIGGYKCFRKYPPHVRLQLVGVSYFVYVSENRVIVRQDQQAQGLYFLITGEVLIQKSYYDPVIDKIVTEDVCKRGTGSMFGEVSLLHKIPRTATVTTLTPCELLYLYEDDFDKTLKATLESQWDEIMEGMALFPYFNDWDKVAVRECCFLSQIVTFEKNSTVLGDGINNLTSTYFLLKGEVTIIEHILTIKKVKRGIESYRTYLPSESVLDLIETDVEKSDLSLQNIHSSQLSKTLIHNKTRLKNEKNNTAYDFSKLPKNVNVNFMTVCNLGEKSVLMDGPILLNRRVVATKKTKFLIIPNYFLLMHNSRNIWTRLQIYMNSIIPSNEYVYQKMLADKKWKTYKENYLKQLLRNVNVRSNTTRHDVPYSLRSTSI